MTSPFTPEQERRGLEIVGTAIQAERERMRDAQHRIISIKGVGGTGITCAAPPRKDADHV